MRREHAEQIIAELDNLRAYEMSADGSYRRRVPGEHDLPSDAPHGWKFPIAINTLTGDLQHDHFGGNWGDEAQLHRFLQAYAVEKCRIEARVKGYQLTETQLRDGSIKLQTQEGT